WLRTRWRWCCAVGGCAMSTPSVSALTSTSSRRRRMIRRPRTRRWALRRVVSCFFTWGGWRKRKTHSPFFAASKFWRTAGRVFLRNCFAFIATFVQNTRVPDATRQPRAVPHPDLSPSRSRGDPQVVLRDGISGRADRSGLRRSTTVCRFSYYLLHRPRTGIVFRARNRWGDRRLSARLAPAVAEPALLFFAKHHFVFSLLA